MCRFAMKIKAKKLIKFIVIALVIFSLSVVIGDMIHEDIQHGPQIRKYIYLLISILFLGNTIIYYVIFFFAFLISKKELEFYENKALLKEGFLFVPLSNQNNKQDTRWWESEWERARNNNWIVMFLEKQADMETFELKLEIFLTSFIFIGVLLKNYFDINWFFHEDHIIISSLINVFLTISAFFLGLSLRSALFKRKLTCNWGRSDKPRTIDGYLCTRITRECVYLCPIWNLHEFSLKKAEQFYDEFKKEHDFIEKRSQIIGLEKRKSVK